MPPAAGWLGTTPPPTVGIGPLGRPPGRLPDGTGAGAPAAGNVGVALAAGAAFNFFGT
jgi:hypothetical protein